MDTALDHAGASLWMDTARPPRWAPLARDVDADVCVVGAGAAGLAVAYTLAGVGHDVLVLDHGALADGASARSTGMLRTAPGGDVVAIDRRFGDDAARVVRAHAAAINAIEDLCRNESIDCGFARANGFLVADGDASDAEGAAVLEHARACAVRAGMDAMPVPSAPTVLEGFGPAVRLAAQARLNPLRFLAGLAEAVRRRGVRLHGDTRVLALEPGDGAEAPAAVRTANGHRVRAGTVVLATDLARGGLVALPARRASVRSFVIALRVAREEVPDVLLWDAAGPSHRVRVAHAAGGSWLLVAGEDRVLDVADAAAPRHAALETWTRRHFPMAGPVGYRWSGVFVSPGDGLPAIGRVPGAGERVFVATSGSAGDRMVHGTLAGLVLPELVAGRDSPFADLVAPGREAHA